MSFIAELKRRNVFKVAAAYVVVAWLVLQIVDTLSEFVTLPEWAGGFVLVLLVAGLPVALFLAWAYELTPEGVKKAEEVDKDASITHVTGQKINYLIIGLMAIALAYFIWESRFSGSPDVSPAAVQIESEQGEPNELAGDVNAETNGADVVSNESIAVLPFVNMSSDEEQEYFSDGLSEELLNVLAHVPQLKVAARTSSFYFKGKNLPIAEVAAKLNVAHVLEGSVRKAGNNLRITAQLIRASDGFHLWSGTYDRALDDVFQIQEDISRAIVDALQIKMGLGEDKRDLLKDAIQKTDSPEAHSAYLLGEHLLRKRTKADIEQAIVHFQRALELDPEYAPAMTAQARGWGLLVQAPGTYGDLSIEESTAKMKPLLDKAKTIAPNLADVYVVEAQINWGQDGFSDALRGFEKALALNPNHTDAAVWRATLMDWFWQFDKKRELRKELVRKDPLSALALINLGYIKIEMGEYGGLGELIARLNDLSPEHAIRLKSYWSQIRQEYSVAVFDAQKLYIKLQGRPASIIVMDRMLRLNLQDHMKDWVSDKNETVRVLWFQATGQADAAVKLMDEYTLNHQAGWDRMLYANALAFAGEWQRARREFESYLREKPADMDEKHFLGFPLEMQNLALARRHSNDPEGAEKMLANAREWLDTARVQGLKVDMGQPENVLAQFILEGQLDAGMKYFRDKVEKGWLPDSRLFYDACCQEMKQHPDYPAIIKIIEKTRVQQQEEFLSGFCQRDDFKKEWPGIAALCQ